MKELEQQYTFAQWLLQDEWLCNECWEEVLDR